MGLGRRENAPNTEEYRQEKRRRGLKTGEEQRRLPAQRDRRSELVPPFPLRQNRGSGRRKGQPLTLASHAEGLLSLLPAGLTETARACLPAAPSDHEPQTGGRKPTLARASKAEKPAFKRSSAHVTRRKCKGGGSLSAPSQCISGIQVAICRALPVAGREGGAMPKETTSAICAIKAHRGFYPLRFLKIYSSVDIQK